MLVNVTHAMLFLIINQSGDLDANGIALCAMAAITNQERLTAPAAPRTQNFGISIKVSGILKASPIRRALARTFILPILARLLKSS